MNEKRKNKLQERINHRDSMNKTSQNKAKPMIVSVRGGKRKKERKMTKLRNGGIKDTENERGREERAFQTWSECQADVMSGMH